MQRELDTLKQQLGTGRQVLVWRNLGESAEAAAAQHLAAHPKDRSAVLLIVGWTEPEGPQQ